MVVRRPAVERAALDAPEMIGWRIIEDNYLPGLNSTIHDLLGTVETLESTVNSSLPVVQGVLANNGVVFSQSQVVVPANSPGPQNKRSKSPIKVLVNVSNIPVNHATSTGERRGFKILTSMRCFAVAVSHLNYAGP